AGANHDKIVVLAGDLLGSGVKYHLWPLWPLTTEAGADDGAIGLPACQREKFSMLHRTVTHRKMSLPLPR
ncbi:hypothetical protein, partial [Mesorhizobium sp.]|uniref:hypothetical protein n=1 Tax=Mesorhizobium sp. TaxID=1871066 RepID=UPI0032AFDCD0